MSLKTILVTTLASIAIAMPSSPIAMEKANPGVTVATWPDFLDGYGSLQVNMTSLAADVNSTQLNQLLQGKQTTDLYNLSKAGADPCTVADPVNLTTTSFTGVVQGDLCLDVSDYNNMVANLTANFTGGGGASNKGQMAPADACDTSCNQCCELSCIGALLLWPLCVAICEDSTCPW